METKTRKTAEGSEVLMTMKTALCPKTIIPQTCE